MTTRSAKRAGRDRQLPQKSGRSQTRPTTEASTLSWARAFAFAGIAVLIIGIGLYLAGGVFLGQRDKTTTAGAIAMRISMDGYDPKVLDAKPGQTLTIDWWNTDGAPHLEGGVHTLVSDALNVSYALPAQSRKTISITAPTTPGDYDFWCDSCCGGKENEQMHGTLRVAA